MNGPRSDSTPSVPPGLDPDRAERAAHMLNRFAEMAVEQAEAMHQAALAAAKAGDSAAAKAFSAIFDHAGRSLRRSLALQVRLAREQLEAVEKKAAAVRARGEEKAQRRRQVARAVNRSIDADDKIGADKAERLTAELWERLIEDEDLDAELALLDHPLEEIVIHLCRDLGIRPDPAWLDPDYSGADWPHGRMAGKTTNRTMARMTTSPSRPGGPRTAPSNAGTSTSRAARKPLPAGSTSSPRSGSTARPGS